MFKSNWRSTVGIERFTYCGPYVKCKVQKTTFTYKERVCSNPKCDQHGDPCTQTHDKFCSECGSAIQEVDVEQQGDAIDPYELAEDLKLELCPTFHAYAEERSAEGVHIWSGNNPRKGTKNRPARPFYIDDEENSLTELRAEDIESELADFAKGYAKELALLRKHYGQANVTLKWGLLHEICY